MSDWEKIEGELSEDRPSEDEPNLTQEQMDEKDESESGKPVDTDWDEGGEG